MKFKTHLLGYPFIGKNREYKKSVEAYWRGNTVANTLIEENFLETVRGIREENWDLQRNAGMECLTVNDGSWYDPVLDTCALFGGVPERFGWNGGEITPELYFQMARGSNLKALEMTKWFNTNYHYLVPEWRPEQTFQLSFNKPFAEAETCQSYGKPKPVLIGPVTLLRLGRSQYPGWDPLSLLPGLLSAYLDALQTFRKLGVEWVQMDEPILSLDLKSEERDALAQAYDYLQIPGLKLMLTNYFGGYGDNLERAAELPVQGFHLDLVNGAEELPQWLNKTGDRELSLGLVDGRNVWRNNLSQSLKLLENAAQSVGPEKLWIAPSCSLKHVPLDASREKDLEPSLRKRLAFAREKLEEISLLARGMREGRKTIDKELADNAALFSDAALFAVANSGTTPVNDGTNGSPATTTGRAASGEAQAGSLSGLQSSDFQRHSPYAVRKQLQEERFNLPVLPTTTIGSFPQTEDIRRKRREWRQGKISESVYRSFLQEEIRGTIRKQEAIGLDVLVHGEPERTDMVEYFAKDLEGVCFTGHGWVQSYGSRCVKPPIIYGDVNRKQPMTVETTKYAQSQTEKPVKGMLTGPITILQWSFVREDIARKEVAFQIALALRREVQELETGGIGMIQVDEPAFREGLPLKQKDREAYLRWASEAFRLATSGVRDDTQIHTHMCYSNFNDVMEHIASLDADVISIEASRSNMKLLEAFQAFKYPNAIGPGVWDIHSPRVPDAQEIAELIRKAMAYIQPDQLWVNPDCGLKTREWKEVEAALKNMVEARESVVPVGA